MTSSLVVPAYNEEKVVQDTLDHLTELEPYFDEIYLMDDASTDSTQEKISNYLQENETDVKVAYMRENGDKIGAIEEAVRHAETDNIVLTDADTRLETPEAIGDAEQHMEDNGYGGLAFKVIPDDSSEGVIDRFWNRLQDFDYAMGRAMADYTTGEKLRLDPDDKNVRCIAGAGGMYDTEVLEEALEHHSGKHAGDDMETTAVTQLVLDEDVDYFSDVEFETDVPKEYSNLKDQRTRWSKGSIQAFSHHPGEYIGEVKPDFKSAFKSDSVKEASGSIFPSRYGQTIAYEAGITAAAPVFLGKAAFEASQGDLAQASNSMMLWYGVDAAFTAGLGAYSVKKDELEDKKTLGLSPIMPMYRAATFFPAKIGSQTETVTEKIDEAGEEFAQGLEEGNSEFNNIRKLGRTVEKSKQKAKGILSFEDEEQDLNSMLEENRQQSGQSAD